jgi:tetratricopeptide (TPR) repeat protein
MSSALKSLAGAAVTALIKSDPSALAIAGGKEALGWLIDRLRGEASQLDQLIAKVESGLAPLAAAELRGHRDLDPAIANATTLFETFGLSAGELVDLNLDPKRATEELLRRGAGMLGPDPKKQKGAIGLCCTKIVPRVHELLLNDPATIASLQPAIARALLAQRDQIDRLPDRVGSALRAQFGRYLVIDPTEVWRAGLPDIYLLRAEYAVVPFHEQRRGEIERLLLWCESDPPLAARVMTGPGGTGKTRLMIELGKEARRRGWRAGFLHREMPAKPSWELDGLVEGTRPLLLVVDYAETRRDVLVPILHRLAMAGGGIRGRVVLLAREVGDWWRRLQDADPKVQEMLDDTLVPIERLVPIAAPVDERRGILGAAAVAFARKLELDAPQPGDIDLSGDHFANALFLHIAGLAVAVGDPAWEEKALLDFVLRRERRQWRENLKAEELWGDLDEATVTQVLALVTLAGGVDDGGGARRLLGRAPKLAGVLPAKCDRLIEMLHRLYPGERFLEPVRPDLLGEHLVDQALVADDRLLTAALADDAVVRPALTVLTRLAKRRGEARRWLEQAFSGDLERLAAPAIEVAIETGEPIGPVLAEALEKQSLQQPWRLEPLIPYPTTALREVAVVVMEQLRQRLQQMPQPWPEEVQVEAARVANNLGGRLSDLGRREAALAAAEEARDLYSALAAARPAAFTPDLAGSLNNLANILSELGRREEALAAAEEAEGLYRALAAARPAAFTPNLAMSLNNLANRLSDLGRREAALAAAEEAMRLRRALAAARPDAFIPALANSLNNLANRLSELGRREDALAAAEEAVRLRRTLAAARPDAFTPDLAVSLAVLANCLEATGRDDDALAANQEAIDTLRPPFLAVPPAFAHWMLPMCQQYFERCERLGREPDGELLAPIVEALAKLEGEAGPSGQARG